MSLLHNVDELNDSITAVECHVCHTKFVGNAIYELDQGGSLRCTKCGSGGMVPKDHAHKSAVAARYPPGFPKQFTPIPNALFECADALALTSAERLVVIVLETYRRSGQREVWPTRTDLAKRSGLPVRSISRAVSGLVDKGLLDLRPGGSREQNRGRGPNRYDLSALWNRINELTFTGQIDP